jgi:hypothetical protein
MFVGYARLPAKTCEIQVWLNKVPGETAHEEHLTSGWNQAPWCLEVEEIPESDAILPVSSTPTPQ